MRVLLDTAVLIFAVETPERLSRQAERILKNAANLRELSSISLTEIAVKASLGKLQISVASAHQAIEDLDIRILPFTADHAFAMFELPLHHRDPFDRQIIAQALWEGIPVISPDETWRQYKGLRLVW